MPIRSCTRDGENGWQWGESGKCYLPSEEGGEGKAKQKAILQGIAIEGPDVDIGLAERILGYAFPDEQITELASLLEVPVLTAGVFRPHNQDATYEVTEEELDGIVEASNSLQPVFKRGIETGEYEGNPEISQKLKELGKPIPGPINFIHQKPLFDKSFLPYVQGLVKNASVQFQKKAIDGKNWIVATIDGLTQEMAGTLQRYFPYRSADMIGLTNPADGTYHPKTIRSIAFLDILTPPAVPGQSPNLIAEFAGGEEPVITLFMNTLEQGEHIMPKELDNTVDVAELQKLEATLTEQNKAIAELKAAFEASEKEKEMIAKEKTANDAKIAELEAKAEKSHVQGLLAEMAGKFRKYGDNAYQVSPAFMEVISPFVESKGIVELADGEDLSAKHIKMFEDILELAGKGTLLVPMTIKGEKAYERSDEQPKTIETVIAELQEKNKDLSDSEAWIQANELLKTYDKAMEG
jgi:hypothetical protein